MYLPFENLYQTYLAFLMSPFSFRLMLAENGLDRVAGAQPFGDLLAVGAAGCGCRLGPGLDRGIGVERVAFRIISAGLELLDDFLGFREVARLRSEGEDHAFTGGAGDGPELLGVERVARHHLSAHALFTHLAQDEAAFRVIAADVDDVDAGVLHLGDEGGVVLFTGGVGLVHRFGHAGRVERLAGLVGQAFAVGRLVVDDGDLLAGIVLGNEVAGDDALGVVTAANAVGVPLAAFR